MTADDKKTLDEAIAWLRRQTTENPPHFGSVTLNVQFRDGKVHLVEREHKATDRPKRG